MISWLGTYAFRRVPSLRLGTGNSHWVRIRRFWWIRRKAAEQFIKFCQNNYAQLLCLRRRALSPWMSFCRRTGPICCHNIHHWLSFPYEDNRCGLYRMYLKKLSAWLWCLTEPVLLEFSIAVKPTGTNSYKMAQKLLVFLSNNTKYSVEIFHISAFMIAGEQTRYPLCGKFSYTIVNIQNWNHRAMWCAYVLHDLPPRSAGHYFAMEIIGA